MKKTRAICLVCTLLFCTLLLNQNIQAQQGKTIRKEDVRLKATSPKMYKNGRYEGSRNKPSSSSKAAAVKDKLNINSEESTSSSKENLITINDYVVVLPTSSADATHHVAELFAYTGKKKVAVIKFYQSSKMLDKKAIIEDKLLVLNYHIDMLDPLLNLIKRQDWYIVHNTKLKNAYIAVD